PQFKQAFEAVVSTLISVEELQESMDTDGALQATEMTLETAQMLETQVWGQGFPPPMFYDVFRVVQQRVLGEKHLKLQLQKEDVRFEAIYFNQTESLPEHVQVVYQIQVNEYNSQQQLQLLIKHAHHS
ncbi:MAG: single-stranded-DNA-specific exonuclease RecJ, partial [Methylophilaceae bacterium 17-44-8]